MAADARGEFIRCPRCGQKTRTKVLPGTVLIEFPLFCPKCKCELIVSFSNGALTKTTETLRIPSWAKAEQLERIVAQKDL